MAVGPRGAEERLHLPAGVQPGGGDDQPDLAVRRRERRPEEPREERLLRHGSGVQDSGGHILLACSEIY